MFRELPNNLVELAKSEQLVFMVVLPEVLKSETWKGVCDNLVRYDV